MADKPNKSPQKVVVVQTAFVGDVVFTSPLVHAIKESHPNVSVSLLVRPTAREVAQCIPGVDNVLTFDKHGEDSGPMGVLRTAKKIRNEEFDLLVSPHRSFRSALLAMLTGVPLRLGYCKGLGRVAYNVSIRPKTNRSSSLAGDLELLQKVGIEPAGTRLRLRGPDNKQGYVNYFYKHNQIPADAKMVALCIGAFWPTKRWPDVYFASLVESLKARGYVPVLFGGPDERIIATKIEELLNEPMISCVGNTLAESAALLEKCHIAVGGDSGLTHMADALGIPTVFIYGPTDPRVHSFGEKVRVLAAKVKCRPCSRHGTRRCPERHHDCMRLVSPEMVVEALKEVTRLETPVPRLEKKETREPIVVSST